MSQLVEWERTRAVIFDVDGTLYDGGRLRRRMLLELVRAVARRPARVRELEVLRAFRSEREKLAEEEASNILALQYERPAARLGITAAAVQDIVDPWILERPLRLLGRFRIRGAAGLFDRLRRSGRSVAVWSDYPARAKLDALGLVADCAVCGTDPEVNRLKPSPAGLDTLLGKLGLAPTQCLVIGDRDDRDGEAARRAGIDYLLRSDRPRDARQLIDFLPLVESFDAAMSGSRVDS